MNRLSLLMFFCMSLLQGAAAFGATAAGGMTPAIAGARTLEFESVVQLTAEGRALYHSDSNKLTGYQYCSMAVGLAERGEFRQALRAASKALFLGIDTRNDDLIAHAKRDLAMAYNYAGNVDRAEQYAQESLKHAVFPRNRGAIHSWAYKTLGDVALRKGDPVKALEMYEKSVREADNSLRFYSRASIAVALATMNDTAKAKDAVRRAESYVEVAGSSEGAARAALQRIRADIALREKDYKQATVFFQAAAATAGDRDTQYERFWAQEGMARALLASGQKEKALEAYLQAVEASQDVRALFRSEEIKTGLFGQMQSAFDAAVELLMDAGRTEAAWQISERGRARALLDLIRERVTPNSNSPAAGLSASDISSRLGDEEAIIDYYVLPTKAYAWIIRKSGISAVELKLTRDDLSKTVEELRTALVQRTPAAQSAGARLHDLLVKPLGLRDGEKLVIVPHDVLHYLPFQALRDDKGYLIEKFEISYSPASGLVLSALERTATKATSFFALANPDLNDPSRALAGAEREVKQIAGLFRSPDAYYGKDATKRRLLEHSGEAHVVHIAAHSMVDRADPLYSQIFLANAPGESGVLEAHEVYKMNLQNAGLVTLSACESGLGKVSRGDEIWGFTRSFLSAGAGSLLVSLWPVADDSTEKLMTSFYRGLDGKSRRASMRSAQLELIKDPSFSHPYFWAAFNLLGDWR